MVVRFEYMWISIPLLLIPILFVVVQMALLRIWIFSSPQRQRARPTYSMHVMRQMDEKENRKSIVPVLPYAVPRSNRGSRAGSTSGTPFGSGRLTPQMQFQQFQNSGRATPQYNPHSQAFGLASGRATPVNTSSGRKSPHNFL